MNNEALPTFLAWEPSQEIESALLACDRGADAHTINALFRRTYKQTAAA